ncbi:oxidoreductase [Geomonas paludis]|uniref:Oxidoreductase n=1 Tax=Geomonas paludis TaxID=2740185 RepID=A0A6V8N231_9BACT|nr:oxidoreductase [Geomonas paludis]UPU36770.1 oxidoreductase [Geomonas paludis]GFO66054.1 SDR family oxidoreductase [Geomonas paludis]
MNGVDIDNKVVVITGAAGRIGSEYARAVAAAGAVAVIADTSEENGRKLADEIIANSGKADFELLDITSKESVQRLITVLTERYGRVDALVNNAYPRNKRYGARLEDVTYEDFCDNVGTHLGGYFLTSQQFGLHFQKQGYGNIVNMASIYGVVAPRFEVYEGTRMTMPVEYAAIKSAVIHLTKYLAKYFKGSNIRVNCISPGGILDAQPVEFLDKYRAFSLSKGMLDPQDLTGTLLYLLSDMSKFVNGQNIVVDDGWAL